MSSHGLPSRFVLTVTTSKHGAVVLAVAVSGQKCVAEAGGREYLDEVHRWLGARR
ncbi:hypothetical protein KYC5002_27800 [Archangium violaceum]|uniref:hypothetical protein n=1 Tax=Archangium violaceum TaxID=83451 RepID=UPI002B30B84F|nr:hypothetical protein KYC5002_27800 [Archangium gephyra]